MNNVPFYLAFPKYTLMPSECIRSMYADTRDGVLRFPGWEVETRRMPISTPAA